MFELTVRVVGETPEAINEYLAQLGKELVRLGELFKYNGGSGPLPSGNVVNYEAEFQRLK